VGAYDLAMHMVWHKDLARVNINNSGGALGKE
jgi:hypothetical protein